MRYIAIVVITAIILKPPRHDIEGTWEVVERSGPQPQHLVREFYVFNDGKVVVYRTAPSHTMSGYDAKITPPLAAYGPDDWGGYSRTGRTTFELSLPVPARGGPTGPVTASVSPRQMVVDITMAQQQQIRLRLRFFRPMKRHAAP